MWIRALDYMPPVHLEFGDALSAALTADTEVRPDDSRYQLRAHMRRGLPRLRDRAADSRPTPTTGIWERARRAQLRPRALRVDAERQGRGVPLPLGEPRRARGRAAGRRVHRGALGASLRAGRPGRLHAARDRGRVLPGRAPHARGARAEDHAAARLPPGPPAEQQGGGRAAGHGRGRAGWTRTARRRDGDGMPERGRRRARP